MALRYHAKEKKISYVAIDLLLTGAVRKNLTYFM